MKKGTIGVSYIARLLSRDLSVLGKVGELLKQLGVYDDEDFQEGKELEYFLEGKSCMELLAGKLHLWARTHRSFATVENLSQVLRAVDLLAARERLVTKFFPDVVIKGEETVTRRRCVGLPSPVEVSPEDALVLGDFLVMPNAVSLAVGLMKHRIRKSLETQEGYDVEQFMRDFENKYYLCSADTSPTKIVWEVILEKLETSEEFVGKLASSILDYLIFFSPEGTEVEDMWELVEQLEFRIVKETFYQALRLLQSMGIVNFKDNLVRLLNLPRVLTQLHSRTRVSVVIFRLGRGMVKAMKKSVSNSLLLEICFLWNKFKEARVPLQVTDDFMKIPVMISKWMFHHGMYMDLVDHTQDSVELFYCLKVPEVNKVFLSMRRWQGYALDVLGYCEEAAHILQPVYRAMVTMWGYNNATTLNAANDYIRALTNMENYVPALQLISDILFKRPQAQRDDGNKVVVALCVTQMLFGSILVKTSSSDPALFLLKEAWRKLSNILGEDDPRTIESLEAIALCRSAHGQYGPAVRIFEEVLKQKRKLEFMGESHPETTKTKFYLGMVYGLKKNYSKALNYLAEAHSLIAESYGRSHEYFTATHQAIVLCLKTFREDPEKEKRAEKKRRKIRILQSLETEGACDSQESNLEAFGSFWSKRQTDGVEDMPKVDVDQEEDCLQSDKSVSELKEGIVDSLIDKETTDGSSGSGKAGLLNKKAGESSRSCKPGAVDYQTSKPSGSGKSETSDKKTYKSRGSGKVGVVQKKTDYSSRSGKAGASNKKTIEPLGSGKLRSLDKKIDESPSSSKVGAAENKTRESPGPDTSGTLDKKRIGDMEAVGSGLKTKKEKKDVSTMTDVKLLNKLSESSPQGI